eukprot:scaffold165413_cov30-Tisochrysis_lutea.AAC.2
MAANLLVWVWPPPRLAARAPRRAFSFSALLPTAARAASRICSPIDRGETCTHPHSHKSQCPESLYICRADSRTAMWPGSVLGRALVHGPT